ncbi:hypothetical protein ACWC5I_16605, partial [Kitasatospora sp. NPDC001574]
MSSARRRRRLPDEVRTTVVRAVLCLAFTLVGIVLAALSSYADSWLMTQAVADHRRGEGDRHHGGEAQVPGAGVDGG